MESELYEAIHQYAARHWWFRGRQRNVLSLLDRYHGRSDGLVLDLGCGPGNNLEALSRYGEVWGADGSEQAIEICRRWFKGRLDHIWLPEKLPYPEKSFDLIVMLDVLEHIEDDVGALHRVLRLLKPGGVLVITVPALKWLWSSHDERHHHKRRYHRGPLRRMFTRLGFSIHRLSYMNSFLLPIMGLVRLLWRPKTWSVGHLEPGTKPWAKVLEFVFAQERHVLRYGSFPIGGSLVVVARRPEDLELEPWVPGMGLPEKTRS